MTSTNQDKIIDDWQVKSWQGRLDDLFGTYIHQNSLEYAAKYMAENTCGYLDIHKEYVYILETAIVNCKENKIDAMKAINEGGGYTPQSVEETLRLLTEFYKLYLQEYEKHVSDISSGVGRV